MPFVTPPNFVAGAVLTEAQLDILSDNETFLANPPKCRVFNSAAISITTSGSAQALTFDSERFDTDTMHSTVTNTGRITFTTAGTYLIGGSVQFASNATGYRELTLRIGGTTTIAVDRRPAVSGTSTFVAISTLYASAAADYVELRAEQTSGGALDVVSASAFSPEFWAIWVSQ